MLLSLAQWLQTLSPDFGFFRVFQYLTFRAVMAALTALLIGLAFGPWVIRRLAELKIDHRCEVVLPLAAVLLRDAAGHRDSAGHQRLQGGTMHTVA